MKCADLFCGAGGTTAGAALAGHQVAWAANHWDTAIHWHQANHPDTTHVCQDLGEMDWTRAPQVDALLASPSCKDWSEAGQPAKRGTGGSHRPDAAKTKVNHQRNRNTAWAVLAAADVLRPQTIVVENVKRFAKWGSFEAWRGVLHSLGYATHVHHLNALDYGGAQDRTRVIVTARLGEALILAPTNGARARSIGECLDPDGHSNNLWSEIASKPERMRWRIRKAQREAGGRCFWANVSEARGRPLSGPFPTATTQSGTQWNLLAGDRMRVLNPAELARSMSFPEGYRLPKQRKLAGVLIGNAMDVNLAAGICQQVAA